MPFHIYDNQFPRLHFYCDGLDPLSIRKYCTVNNVTSNENLPESIQGTINRATENLTTAETNFVSTSVADIFVWQSKLSNLRLVFPFIDQAEDNTGLLDKYLLRYTYATTHKKNIAEQIQCLLDAGLGTHWMAEVKAGVDWRSSHREALLRCFSEEFPELYGVLFNYFNPVTATNTLSTATPTPLTDTSHPWDDWVTALQDDDSLNLAKVSSQRLKTLMQRSGYTNLGQLKSFVQGYYSSRDLSPASSQTDFFTSPEPEPDPDTLLKGASYFANDVIIEDTQFFTQVRNSDAACFLYLNPADFSEVPEITDFQTVAAKPTFVGAHGAGLKHLAKLVISIEGEKIKPCYELKVHGIKARLLCYSLAPDNPSDPRLIIPCHYLKDGFHGKSKPGDLKLSVSKPDFSVPQAAPEAESALSHS